MKKAARWVGVLLVLAAVPADAAPKASKSAKQAVVPAAPSVRSGVDLWRAGSYAEAVAVWQPFAEAGDKDALFNIGQAYKLGRALPKDPEKALDYFRRAATQGHLPAQANLGILLFQAGEKAEAVKWLKAAADNNEMRAQYVLGVASWNGDGVPRNLTLAYGYLARASALGLPEATTALNTLTGTISPLERANGWAVATSIQKGNGVPPEFAGGQRSAVASTQTLNREQANKPLPKPVVETPAPAPVAVAAATPVAAAPQPVALPPADVAPAPVPVPVPTPAPVKVANAVKAPVVVAKVQTAPVPKPPAVERAVDEPVKTVAIAPSTPAAVSPPVRAPEPVKVAVAVPKAVPKKPDSWRVQLGAFSKKAMAETAWADVKTKQKLLVGSKKPIFQEDGNVTKLQLGPFASRDAAKDACAKIAFSGRACFVTMG